MTSSRLRRGNGAWGGTGGRDAKPRGKNCRWTPELDEVLRAAWARGGARAAWKEIKKQHPTWSLRSIKRRTKKLGLVKQRRPWTLAELLVVEEGIDSNASLKTIAERIGRSVMAVRLRLARGGFEVSCLGGFKAKDLADWINVSPRTVRYWKETGLLHTKRGRITEHSFTEFCRNHPEKIPYEQLRDPDMKKWLREMGYPTSGDRRPCKAQTEAELKDSKVDEAGRSHRPFEASPQNEDRQPALP